MLDLNNITPDEGNDFSLIPHGTIARAILYIKPQIDGVTIPDMSPEANALRQIPSLDAINGMEFCIKIAVEKGTNGYEDKNKMLAPITINQEGYIGGGNAPAPVQPTVQAQPQVQQPQSGVTPSWANK